MIRVGIVAALPGEIRTLTTKYVSTGEVVALSDRIGLVNSGIGPRAVRRAGEALLNQGAKGLLSWGCAAALDDRLVSGSLILPRQVMAYDYTPLPVCDRWHHRLYQRLKKEFLVYKDPLIESPTIVVNPLQKHHLFRDSRAIAVDMESVALGRLALEAQVPFVVVRAIADTANMTVPRAVLRAVDGQGRIRPLPLAADLLSHPRDWIPLIRVARGFRTAQITLIRVAHCLGEELAPGFLDNTISDENRV